MIGIINNRGVVTRGKGGDQERELVKHYTQYAFEIESRYPITASILSDTVEVPVPSKPIVHQDVSDVDLRNLVTCAIAKSQDHSQR